MIIEKKIIHLISDSGKKDKWNNYVMQNELTFKKQIFIPHPIFPTGSCFYLGTQIYFSALISKDVCIGIFLTC